MYINKRILVIAIFYIYVFYCDRIRLDKCIKEKNMTVTINNKRPNNSVFSSFQTTARSKNIYSSLYYKRNHRVEDADTKTKAKIAAGSILATILPMILIAKKQPHGLKKIKDLFNIEYGVKDVIALSSASIFGGVLTGIVVDKKADKKRKAKEGVFQFMNAVVPTALVGGAMQLLKDNTKYKNSRPVKIAAIVTSLVAGMPLAAWISNIINDPKDKEPDRKLTLKDSIVNMDDALGALVVAKVPVFGLDKLLPVIFAWCGYRAGQSN